MLSSIERGFCELYYLWDIVDSSYLSNILANKLYLQGSRAMKIKTSEDSQYGKSNGEDEKRFKPENKMKSGKKEVFQWKCTYFRECIFNFRKLFQ